MQSYTQKPRTHGQKSLSRSDPKDFESKTDIVSSDGFGRKHRHHHHHHGHSSHRHGSHHRHHHHHRHGSHHRHHHHHHRPRHHHHHHRRTRSYSTCSDCSDDSSDYHYDHHSDLHFQSVRLPKIITPQPMRIITPTPNKTNTSVYREIGINTGTETKIMRDSGVTADLADTPTLAERRLEQIPVVRRTIIIEPYPAQPTSQIIVKPRADMVGKIRLGKNAKLNGDDETIIYPSTAFSTKKIKKKKPTVVNHTMIEDLNLDDLNDDDQPSRYMKSRKTKKVPASKIKNAFYN